MNTQTFPAVTVTVTTPINNPAGSAVVVLDLGDLGTLQLSVHNGRLEAFGGGSAEVDTILDAINR